MDNDVKLGKFISLILRHKPETIDLKLDENGWADTKELIEKISKSGREIDFTTLERIVNENNKKRYSFNEDKTKIRAVQGHSIEVNLELKEVVPPTILYHGTAFKNLESIKKEGMAYDMGEEAKKRWIATGEWKYYSKAGKLQKIETYENGEIIKVEKF